jgi:hypothetical protein
MNVTRVIAATPLVAAISKPDCLESRVSRYREQRGCADVKHIELESGLDH